jgi:putative peptide zinc metalloprotease protein
VAQGTEVPGTSAGSPAGGAATASADDVPQRADGVELLGEVAGSGYRRRPALARRADGQTVSLTPLLYAVLDAVDGRRDYGEVAAAVGERVGRLVSADDVRVLVDARLRPLGLLRQADGSQPAVPKANPLLALRFKVVVSDPAVTRRITAPFAVLFRAPVVVAVVLAFVATSGWVLFEHGLAAATREALYRPELLLLVFAVTVLSAGFHEFGHAAACRFGGATPGAMGAGLYLVWPAFYTEVGDSYRLGRGGRVRVDLGGLYFNAIVSVAMFAAWAASGWDALLLVIATQLLQMLRQLAPFVRFDGYHLLADLVGVPDLYAHIGPTLRRLLPWRRPGESALRPWAQAVVTAWVLVVVPLLLLSLAVMVAVLPRLVATAWDSLGLQWRALGDSWTGGDGVGVGVALLSVLGLLVPLVGIGYLLARVVGRAVRRTARATAGRPFRRAGAVLVAAGLATAVAWAWWPGEGRYEPIGPGERGTLVDGLALAVARTPYFGEPAATSQRPALREGEVAAAATTVWASSGTELPTEDDPRLALVLVPREGADAGDQPAWVFPFDPPAAPGEGGNQALAVNTADGGTVYDVAFALVWVTDGSATERNEAYALASCRDCVTVAVAFQVVLVLGEADLVIPQNIAAAVNYSCVECLTYALATQLVVTLPDGLSADAMDRLALLWQEIGAFAADLEDVPLATLQAELARFEAAILDVLREEAAAVESGSRVDEGGAPAPAATGTAGPGGGDATPAPDPGSSPDGSASPAPTARATSTPDTSATPAPTPSATSGAATATPTPTPTSTAAP